MKTFSRFVPISASVIFIASIIAVTVILSTSKSQTNDSFIMQRSVAKKLQEDLTCGEYTDSDGITCTTHCNNAGAIYAHCLKDSAGHFQNCYEDDNAVYCVCSNNECKDS